VKVEQRGVLGFEDGAIYLWTMARGGRRKRVVIVEAEVRM
jgi:hypothetical protein